MVKAITSQELYSLVCGQQHVDDVVVASVAATFWSLQWLAGSYPAVSTASPGAGDDAPAVGSATTTAADDAETVCYNVHSGPVVQGVLGPLVMFGGSLLGELAGPRSPGDASGPWKGSSVCGTGVLDASVRHQRTQWGPSGGGPVPLGTLTAEDNMNVAYCSAFQRRTPDGQAHVFQGLGLPGSELLVKPWIPAPAVTEARIPLSVAQLLLSGHRNGLRLPGVVFRLGDSISGELTTHCTASVKWNNMLQSFFLRSSALLCDAEVPWDVARPPRRAGDAKPSDCACSWFYQQPGPTMSPTAAHNHWYTASSSAPQGAGRSCPVCSASLGSPSPGTQAARAQSQPDLAVRDRDYAFTHVVSDSAVVVLHVSPSDESVRVLHRDRQVGGEEVPVLLVDLFTVCTSDLERPVSNVGHERCKMFSASPVPRPACAPGCALCAANGAAGRHADPTADTARAGTEPSLAVAAASGSDTDQAADLVPIERTRSMRYGDGSARHVTTSRVVTIPDEPLPQLLQVAPGDLPGVVPPPNLLSPAVARGTMWFEEGLRELHAHNCLRVVYLALRKLHLHRTRHRRGGAGSGLSGGRARSVDGANALASQRSYSGGDGPGPEAGELSAAAALFRDGSPMVAPSVCADVPLGLPQLPQLPSAAMADGAEVPPCCEFGGEVADLSLSTPEVVTLLASNCVEFGIGVDLSPLFSIMSEIGLVDMGFGPRGSDAEANRSELHWLPAHVDDAFRGIVKRYFMAVPGTEYFVFVGDDRVGRRTVDSEQTVASTTAGASGSMGDAGAPSAVPGLDADTGRAPGQRGTGDEREGGAVPEYGAGRLFEDGLISFTSFGSRHGGFQTQHDAGEGVCTLGCHGVASGG